MNHQEIIDEIKRDIKGGVFDVFPKLKAKLEIITSHLFKCIYVKNYIFPVDYLKILRENDYMTKYEYKKELGGHR